MTHITKHAQQRGKERLGLNLKAFEKTASKALEIGKTHGEFSGSFKRYLDKLYFQYRNANNMRVFGHYIYLFKNDDLITVFLVPNKYKNASLK